METFQVKGPFGVRFVGVAAGTFSVDDVDGFLEILKKADGEGGTVTQAFNASHLAGPEHLVHAARLAILASENKAGFAGSLGIELICWVAAERQIGRAFEKMGLHKGRMDLAILSVGHSRDQVRRAVRKVFGAAAAWDNSLMELRKEKLPQLQKTFSIGKGELAVAPIECVILERVALLALAK